MDARGIPKARGIGGRFGNYEKPENAKSTTLRLVSEMRGHIVSFLVIVVLSLLIAAYSAFSPYLIGKIVSGISEGGSVGILIAALLALTLSEFIERVIQGFMMAPLGQSIVHTIRTKLFRSLVFKRLSYFDRNSSGDLMSRMVNDTDAISATLGEVLANLVTLSVTLITVLIVMLTISTVMTATVVIIVPFILILAKIITKRTRGLFRRRRECLGSLTGRVEEIITGYGIIKTYSKEAKAISEFVSKSDSLRNAGVRAQVWSGLLMPFSNVLSNLDFILVVLVGALLTSKGVITVGVISSFALYAKQFNRPINEIASIISTLQSTLAGAERVFEVFDEEGEIVEKSGKKSSIEGRIEFRNVSFSYEEGYPVIKNFSAVIEKGMKVALVGETGCGKTTIVNLLAGMYKVGSGEILLDGRNIDDYPLDELRACFSVVLQDAELFHKSVYENLCYGSKTVDRAGAEEVAKAVGAASFIRRLKDGYDTVLNEQSLSLGERQLLTIARAIMKNSPIVILDEATSNVDTGTERKIKKAIDAATEGRTSFFIAHRLSTIRDSDLIIMMKNGEIIEMGNHEELVALGGEYSEMYSIQSASSKGF